MDEIIEANNEDRRSSVGSVSNSALQMQSPSSAVREIQVTAKEIVDRISNPQGTVDPTGAVFDDKQGKPTGYVKPFTGSDPSGNSSSDEKGEDPKQQATKDKDTQAYSTPPSASNAPPQNDRPRRLSSKNSTSRMSAGSFTSENGTGSLEQRAIDHLLEVVQKVVQEAHPEEDVRFGDMVGHTHWAYSVESYVRSLEVDWKTQKSISQKFANQLLGWIKQLFHFGNEPSIDKEFNSIHPHWDSNGGLALIAKLSLHAKFPEILAQGYQYFHEANKPPVIYCGDDLVGQQICFSLGLPLTYTSIINFTEPNWVEELESKIKTDIDKGKVPVALFVNAAVENLEQGAKVAETFKVWTHVYGNNVIPYFLKRPETKQIGNSMSIDLTRWLRQPKLPHLTIYKTSDRLDTNVLDILGLGSPKNEILCFSPWLTVHPNWSRSSDGNVIISTLTFQYNPPHYKTRNLKIDPQSSPNTSSSSNEPSAQYVDTLNSWLFHIMERDLKGLLSIEFVFVESRGWNIHIDVARSHKLLPNEEAAILNCFDSHMKVLHATVKQRLRFLDLVKQSEELEWIDAHDAHWAGLGAVRYIPKFFRKAKPVPVQSAAGDANQNPEVNGNNKEDNATNGAVAPTSTTDVSSQQESNSQVAALTEQETAEARGNIDHLNAKIVDKLKAIDSAFSLGEASNGVWCVQFGMVTEDTDVKELVRLVISTGLEIEESSEFLDKMSELVKKGIEKATAELKQEAEEAMWEEGILRRVPVVGTFVSWFSPPAKESGVRGRALNLTQGRVESTENIYKYHMQIDSSSIPNNFSSNIKTIRE